MQYRVQIAVPQYSHFAIITRYRYVLFDERYLSQCLLDFLFLMTQYTYESFQPLEPTVLYTPPPHINTLDCGGKTIRTSANTSTRLDPTGLAADKQL